MGASALLCVVLLFIFCVEPLHGMPSACEVRVGRPKTFAAGQRNTNSDKDSMAQADYRFHLLAQSINNSDIMTLSRTPGTVKSNLLLYREEIPKFLTLSAMMFLIVFIFTIARDTKDVLIVTNCGAEAIAFLKVYGVVPAASLFLIGYSHLAHVCSPRMLFYVTVAPFIAFYFLFAFVLYPLRHTLHPMSIALPEGGLSFAVNLLRHWTFALYYVVSELWGSAGIPLLFWSCANDVVRIDQAKRLYPLISLVGNLGPILAGLSMSIISRAVTHHTATEEAAFALSLQVLAGCSTVAGVLVCALYAATMRLHDAEVALLGTDAITSTAISPHNQTAIAFRPSEQQAHATKAYATTTTTAEPLLPSTNTSQHTTRTLKEPKPKLSFVQSLRVLSTDPYLRNIAMMVLAYGVTIEFTEIIWKSAVKRAFPVKTEYLAFMGSYSTYVGSAAFVMMLVGTSVVERLGWQAGALVTPIAMGLLALPFFGALLTQGLSTRSALLTAVYSGLAQNVLSKASKYAVFDPTKEMAYIPLDAESKTKGKAAIDVLGARLGKSGGALVQQVLVLLLGSILQGAPLVAALFYVVIFAWIGAVNSLAPMFTQKTAAAASSAATERGKVQ